MNADLHKAQLHILDSLRRHKTQSFSQLMKPLGMESDAFKFHLRKTCDLGLTIKTADNLYTLTPKGKEFANKLSRATRTPRQQPKLSLLILASRQNLNGEVEYLSQKRLRQPFYDYWSGTIGGPILWGESYEDAAARELRKQTGLTANRFEVRLFYRQRDYNVNSQSILEDKLFVVLQATGITGELRNDWPGGQNAWLTLTQLETTPRAFKTLQHILAAIEQQRQHVARESHYTSEQY